MSEITAVIWAKELYDATICRYLKKGERFTFPNSDETMIYSGRGWCRRERDGQKFRTGMNVAVIPKEKS